MKQRTPYSDNIPEADWTLEVIMEHLDKTVLNHKLAEWAGVDSHFLNSMNFTESLDACFVWFIPKLDKGCDIYVSRHWDREGFSCAISNVNEPKFKGIFAKADSPALALCLAIEKVIDDK